jgi:DNA (cytosine-5)-methyltransferase 1
VRGETIRSRLLSSREAARLMGLPDSYVLPVTSSKAYKLCGDGLCVPVIRHIAEHLVQRLLMAADARLEVAE